MKNLTLIIFISLHCSLFTFHSFSQPCLPEGITFTTQAQIDNFQINYPNCMEIEGDVTIYGDDITNLNGLNNVTSIGGTLQIGNDFNMTGANPVLASLEGLSNLSAVGGDLYILGNDILVDLSGLESLTTIGESLLIGGWWNTWVVPNIALLSLDGLENLTSIGDGIRIYGGGIFGFGVEDISALSGLTSISGDVKLRFLPTIINLEGLHNISSIGGNLNLSLLGLTNLSGLDNLSYIAGGFGLTENDSLISLTGLTQLDSIGGGLGIWSNYALENLLGLGNITAIGGSLSIGFNDTLTSLTGLENINIASIENLEIRNNKLLSTCEVQCICDYLASPNGTVEIHDNAPGCNSPEEVEDACWTSVDEIDAIHKLSIYPNPFSNSLTIEYELKQADIVLLGIYNYIGEPLEQMAFSNSVGKQKIEWNCEGLSAGIYFCVIKTNEGIQTIKMIKL